MADRKWEANETQKSFMGVLADGKVKSLRQINAELGREIKTGSITALITKGLVKSIPDGVEYSVEIVETRTYADGLVVVKNRTKTDTETGYQLVVA